MSTEDSRDHPFPSLATVPVSHGGAVSVSRPPSGEVYLDRVWDHPRHPSHRGRTGRGSALPRSLAPKSLRGS